MKVTVKVETELDVAAILCECPVRYDDEDIPHDFPFRKGDMWIVIVDADTGRIRDWPAGREASVHMKLTDTGSFHLLDPDGNRIASRTEDYVPSCVPGKWGDYIEFDISGDGTVSGWKTFCTARNIKDSFETE